MHHMNMNNKFKFIQNHYGCKSRLNDWLFSSLNFCSSLSSFLFSAADYHKSNVLKKLVKFTWSLHENVCLYEWSVHAANKLCKVTVETYRKSIFKSVKLVKMLVHALMPSRHYKFVFDENDMINIGLLLKIIILCRER
jgi:hypothetical protein